MQVEGEFVFGLPIVLRAQRKLATLVTIEEQGA